MNTFESMLFTLMVFLGVWMLTDILENVAQNDSDEDTYASNRMLMDRMIRNKFFSEHACERGSPRFYYH